MKEEADSIAGLCEQKTFLSDSEDCIQDLYDYLKTKIGVMLLDTHKSYRTYVQCAEFDHMRVKP